MKYSRKSVVPTYTVVIPWPHSSPPVYPVHRQTQDSYQFTNQPAINHSENLTCRYLLIFFGGLIIVMLLGISVVIPFLIMPDWSSNEISTITSTIMSSTITTTTAFFFRWNITGETIAGVSSSYSNTANRLNTPARITIDSSDSLYIADANNHRVQKYLLNSSTGVTVAGLSGVQGTTSVHLRYPNDVAVDSNGNMYVVDSYNHRVQLWNAGATAGISIIGNVTSGNSINQLKYPRGITTDSKSGIIYVSDRDNNRVLSYSPNTSLIKVAAGGVGFGKRNYQLYGPTGLDFDSLTNSLIIINSISHTVVRWVLGATNWTLIAGNINGTSGNSSTEVNNPGDVTVDPMGNIYIADTDNHRIQFFPVGQTNAVTIAGVNGVSGNDSILLNGPISVALDSQYNLKTISRYQSKKIKYTVVAITSGLTIAILIIIAVLIPTITKSKSSTTETTISTSVLPGTTGSSNVPPTVSTSIPTAVSTTDTITTSFTSDNSILSTNGMSPASSDTTVVTTAETITVVFTSTSITKIETSIAITTSEALTISTSKSIATTEITTVTTSDTVTTLLITSEALTISTSKSIATTEMTTLLITSEIPTSTAVTSTATISFQWNTTGLTVAGRLNATTATPDYLNFPVGIFIDTSDTLYVTDGRNNRIQRFLLGNTTGKTVAGSPSGGAASTASFLRFPSDVAVDLNGNVYVADSNNNRIQLWYANATSGITLAGNGSTGNSPTQLSAPRNIAFNSNMNTFYVSDSDNHRVMSYTLNSTVGTLVAGGNGAGRSNTQLFNPRGLHFDATTNSLIIANADANNVVQWVIGASSWTIVVGNSNGSSGNSKTTLSAPWDVTLDPMRNVYVADRVNHRIQFFQAGQLNATTIAGITGQPGTDSLSLNGPLSLALDSQLNLYVADTNNNRTQKFLRY